MAIYHTNITLWRDTYCVHLQDEDELYFLVPLKHGSDNWGRLQAWLDEGNEIVDDMSNQDTHYKAQSENEYPSIADQSAKFITKGLMLGRLRKALKDKYPKGQNNGSIKNQRSWPQTLTSMGTGTLLLMVNLQYLNVEPRLLT